VKRPRGPGRRRQRLLTLRVGRSEWVVWYHPWRGCSPPVCRPTVDDSWVDTWKEYFLEVEEMKRPSVKVRDEAGALARVEVPKLLAKLPNVAELVIQPGWEEGDGKGERAVFAFVSATLVKLLVKVQTPPLKLMVSGRTWDEAWAVLEAVLRSDDVPWEQDEGPKHNPTRKRK